MRYRQVGAGTEEADVLEMHAGGVAAAAAPEVEAGIERPHVPGGDAHVDRAVVIAHHPDPGIVEIAVGAQDALGLIEQAARVALPRLEEQLTAYDARACPVMQAVGQAEQPAIVLRVIEVEDV